MIIEYIGSTYQKEKLFNLLRQIRALQVRLYLMRKSEIIVDIVFAPTCILCYNRKKYMR